MQVETDTKREARGSKTGATEEAVAPDIETPVQSEMKRSSPNSLSVIYTIVAMANNQPVIKLDSCYELPHALEAEFIPLADASVAKLFEILVSNPLQTGIRAFLQRRFEELRAQAKSTARQVGIDEKTRVCAPESGRHGSDDPPDGATAAQS